MKTYRNYLHHWLLLAALLCSSAQAEDIDIFAGTSEENTGLPNIIFVLDNTSNWSRQSQKWPGGLTQGQSEVRAIKLALAAQLGKVNVGIVEYNTGGSTGENKAAYTRFDLQELNATSVLVFNAILDKIFVDINDPEEKRSSSNPYGDLAWDFYNYLSGINASQSGAGTPGNLADADAYTAQWGTFASPLVGKEAACGDTYMIFIGNNANGKVKEDDSTNSNALKAAYIEAGAVAPDALYGDGGTPMAIPEFVITEVQGPDVDVPAEEVTQAFLGLSGACYKSNKLNDCKAAELADGLCEDLSANPSLCRCTTPNTAVGCDKDEYWTVERLAGTVPAYTKPGELEQVVTVTGDVNTTLGKDYNFDDWAKFLKNYGVPMTFVDEGVTYSQRVKVTTYVIDVYNAQSDATLSGIWFGAANAGGGRYFQAKSEDEIIAAINSTLGDILAVSSSFAAVTLPLSANNTTRRANEIYVGMFRPAPGKSPRWYGNLKRFQLARFTGQLELADRYLRKAINPLTGFARDCAASYWTYDSDRYWENLGVDPSLASKCDEAITAAKEWSDLPDGPFVEKGAVGQVTRLDPAGVSRKVLTSDGTDLVELDTGATAVAALMGGQNVLDYVLGTVAGVGEVMPVSGLRASIHGDVIHSRPFTIRYDDGLVLAFYGANDGPFRAVNTDNGQEEWAFIAPEHFSKLARLYNNTPLVEYEGAVRIDGETYAPKDYFFDGSAGSIVTYEDPVDPTSDALTDLVSAYIYPIMRRGGRMVYGLDVTDPGAPELMWSKGCPNLDNDTGCTAGFADLGQTWSTPIGIKVAGYPDVDSDPTPLIVMGGGFDDCLNTDLAAYPPACSSAKGKDVWVLDAQTGALIKRFETDAPVITEVAPIDVNADGLVDFVYIVDAAGDLYRIRHGDLVVNLFGSDDVPDDAIRPRDDEDEWVIEKIASVPGNTRRGFNAPVVALFQENIFIAWGTGDRERPLEVNYPFREDVQNRFYVLADRPFDDYLAEEDAGDAYVKVPVDMEGDTIYEVGTDLPDDKVIRDFDGWYLDLADQGEQVANKAAIGGGKILFDTFQPGGVSTGICEEPLGIGQNYTIDLFNPEEPEVSVCAGGGYCIPPVIDIVEDVPDGCEDGEECWYEEEECPEGEPNCSEDIDCDDEGANCENEFPCIRGGFDVCDLDPVVSPNRGRTYFTEDIDR